MLLTGITMIVFFSDWWEAHFSTETLDDRRAVTVA